MGEHPCRRGRRAWATRRHPSSAEIDQWSSPSPRSLAPPAQDFASAQGNFRATVTPRPSDGQVNLEGRDALPKSACAVRVFEIVRASEGDVEIGSSFRRLQERSALRGHSRTLVQPRQLGSCIESEHDLVRFLVAPMGEPAALAHEKETALRQHTNRRRVIARSVSVKRTSLPPAVELL